MKKLILKLTVIIVVIIITAFIIAKKIPVSAPPYIDQEPEIEATQTFYLVPVTNFKALKTNYSRDEILGSGVELSTTESNKILIGENNNIKTIPDENFDWHLTKEKTDADETDEIYLLRPEQVNEYMKTLTIDGNNFWSSNFNSENYPFKYELDRVNSEDENLPNFEIIDRNKITTIFASGEIIPARAVDRLGLNKYNDYTYLFDFFRNDIENADLSIAMLENSLLGNPVPCTGCTNFVSDDQVAKGIADSGFDMLSLAGNHAGDGIKQQEAYANTIKLFTDWDVKITGTGNNSGYENKTDESGKEILGTLTPAIEEINGKRIGLIGADDIAYFYWNNDPESTKYRTNNFSTRDEKGSLTIDKSRVEQIAKLKEFYKIDYLIVYMSWGVEYTNYSTTHQQELAHAMIDNGANLIVSSHPHWVQNIEFYKDVPIIYALGNFVFDQTHTLESRQGAAVNFYYYDRKLKSIELMPLQTCGYHQTKNDLTPKLLNDEMTLDEIYKIPEKDGCVYWQPKKLKSDHASYNQILERIFEFTQIE